MVTSLLCHTRRLNRGCPFPLKLMKQTLPTLFSLTLPYFAPPLLWPIMGLDSLCDASQRPGHQRFWSILNTNICTKPRRFCRIQNQETPTFIPSPNIPMMRRGGSLHSLGTDASNRGTSHQSR